MEFWNFIGNEEEMIDLLGQQQLFDWKEGEETDKNKQLLSKRMDVVHRAILRGIKKFYLHMILKAHPEYKRKRICRVKKEDLLEDIRGVCRKISVNDELPKAVFCILRTNSIDFAANTDEFKEQVTEFLNCMQRYSHKKYREIMQKEFAKILFYPLFEQNCLLSDYMTINSLMNRHIDIYEEELRKIQNCFFTKLKRENRSLAC